MLAKEKIREKLKTAHIKWTHFRASSRKKYIFFIRNQPRNS